MKWTKVSLKTTNEAVDLVCNMINELGIEGSQIEDNIPITEEEKKAAPAAFNTIKASGKGLEGY